MYAHIATGDQLDWFNSGQFYFRLRFRIIELMAKLKLLSASLNAKRLYLLFSLLFILYFVLIFFTNPAQSVLQGLHNSEDANRWYSLAIRLPLVLIWLTAFYGYIQFSNYVRLLGDSREAPHLRLIGRGLLALTIGMPLTFVIGNALIVLDTNGLLSHNLRIALSFFPMVITQLLAFSYLCRGAYPLAASVKRAVSFWAVSGICLLAVIVSAIYCFLITNNGLNPVAHPFTIDTKYMMPNWLVVIGITVPYLMAWLYGGRAVFDISQFQRFVKGTLYKKALRCISIGIGLIVLGSIAAQYVSTLSRQLLNLSPLSMFLIAYALYAVVAVGYILIASGARRLRKIEEA